MAKQFANETVNHPRAYLMPKSSYSSIENDRHQYELLPPMGRQSQYRTTQPTNECNGLFTKPLRTHYAPPIAYPQLNRRICPTISSAVSVRSTAPKPLRIIIIRHAERADAVLGSDWSRKSFDKAGRYIRFSEHLPDNLPNRSYLHHYVIDVPLTNRGRAHSFKTGKALLFNGYGADICYSSPSLRCVQTADGILNGMGRGGVPIQLEPGLFECYLNDFKRTLCFMTKDELASNGYNIDKSYQVFMPFMRPHDSQLDYYERCRMIMDVITERHQHTGGTVLVVAHAPSLEGLTRHLTGGKVQPERLFDIARRVPFLAMTIIERNMIDSLWLFRTQPLQTGQTKSTREVVVELTQPLAPLSIPIHNYSANPHGQQQKPASQTQRSVPQPADTLRVRSANALITIDPKKVVKSSTEPNLRQSNSLSNMFRVI